MSPGNQRDLSGLLYLPGEELVRSTIDGDDADWSEAFSYVPRDSVVRTVLDASRRERPAFILPSTLLPNRAVVGRQSRAKRTAALLAGLGLSPFSLAAAAVLHVAFLFAVGPWIVTQAGAARSIQMPPPPVIVATRLVYDLPTPGKPPPVRRPRKQPSRSIAQSTPVDTSSRANRTVSQSRLDSLRAGGWRGESRSMADAPSEELQAANALSQEFVFAGDGFELEPRDRPKVEVMVRLLTRWPGLRLRVIGDAPRRREGGPLPGMAEAEALKRLLVQAGIDADRIEVGQMPEEERRCPEFEPNCGALRRRVRTMSPVPR